MAGRSRVVQQLTYLVPGAAISYWLETPRQIWTLATEGGKGYARSAASASLLSGAVVVGLFLYLIFLPMLKGEGQPNYHQWRADGELSVVIPLLTGSMVFGWSLLWFTFAWYTGLGGLEGFLGALGLYLTVFGTLGLIPAPFSSSRSRRSSHPH